MIAAGCGYNPLLVWRQEMSWVMRGEVGGIVRQRLALGTVLLCCMIIVAGCGGGRPAQPTPTAEPEISMPPLTLQRVIWTEDVDPATGEPVGEVDTYTTTSPAIIAVVQAANVPAGTGLTATWTIDGLEVPEATMQVEVDNDYSAAWVSFEFAREEGRYFPLGVLELTVTANTGETIQDSVTIELP